MSEYNFEEERMPFEDFDYRDDYPTEEMLQNWNEANDYLHEGEEYDNHADEDDAWLEEFYRDR